jgi:hypothetical protein
MSVPKNKSEFIEHCLRRLGQPVIKVNVASEQLDDRIDEASYRFYEKHYLATELIWAIFTPSWEDVRNGYVILPEDIIGVSDVFHASNTANIYSIDFLMKLSELSALSKTQFAGINYYFCIKMHLELLNEMFSPERQYNFNPLSHKLILAGGLKDVKYTEGVFALRCYRKLGDFGHKPNDEIISPENINDHHEEVQMQFDKHKIPVNIYQDRWFQRYATALIKEQWGMNMSKYQNVQLLGGISMNGDQIKAEAKEEIRELEEELNSTYDSPPIGLIG